MDRMRESLFSILGDLTGCSFLDLFSGSGCVAIEAASRGADPIHLVELDRGKKAVIEKNLSYVEESHRLFTMDVMRFLTVSGLKYSVVYADPPFSMEGKTEILRLASESKAVKDTGLFIIHLPREDRKLWEEKMYGFTLEDERHYGRSFLLFYRPEVDEKC